MIFTLVPNACKIPCILPLVTDDTTALTANQKTKRKQIQSDSSLVWGFPHPQLSVPPVSSRPYSCNQFCVTVAPTFTAVSQTYWRRRDFWVGIILSFYYLYDCVDVDFRFSVLCQTLVLWLWRWQRRTPRPRLWSRLRARKQQSM